MFNKCSKATYFKQSNLINFSKFAYSDVKLDKNEAVWVSFLDFHNIFDTVKYKAIIKKLKKCGISRKATK